MAAVVGVGRLWRRASVMLGRGRIVRARESMRLVTRC